MTSKVGAETLATIRGTAVRLAQGGRELKPGAMERKAAAPFGRPRTHGPHRLTMLASGRGPRAVTEAARGGGLGGRGQKPWHEGFLATGCPPRSPLSAWLWAQQVLGALG